MAGKRIQSLGWAFAIIAAALGAGHAALLAWPAAHPIDEFGRNLFGTTLVAVGNSLLTAIAIAAMSLLLPVIVGYFAATSSSRIIEHITYGVTRVLDVIPLFVWIAIAFVALGTASVFLKAVSVTLVSFPYVLGICLPQFGAIARSPFARNSKLAGTPLSIRLFRHFLPNALPVLAYPFTVVFSVSVMFDAALGLFGMITRSDLTLGVLLVRAKERGAVDIGLVVSAGIALALCMLVFWLFRPLLERSAGSKGLSSLGEPIGSRKT